jgi:hypothetical protein
VDDNRLWRRRRTGGFTFLWGLLGGVAGMVYGVVTAGQPDTPLFDALSALGIVLLFTGCGVAGIGLLSWIVASVGLRRSGAGGAGRGNEPH